MTVLGSTRRLIALAFLISLGVISAQIYLNGPRVPEADELIYVEIAYDLNTSNTYSNGWSEDRRDINAPPRPGRFFGPVFPILLWAMSQVDPAVGEFITCVAVRAASCPDVPLSLLTVQTLIAAIQMAGVFAIALALSESAMVGAIALVLALIFGKSAIYATAFLTENTAFLGFYLFLAAGVYGVRLGRAVAFALAGVGLAIAILSRPGYLYLFYATVVVMFILALIRSNRLGISWRHGAAFAGVCLALISPWMVRNLIQFGDPALTAGYGAYILVQRVAYNAMSWGEWGVAFIFWLPDFGDNLARALFSPDLYARLGFEDPTSFFVVGNGHLRQTTLAASGGPENHLSYLLRTYVLGDLFKHIMVTFPITWRGIWAGKYLAISGILFLPAVGIHLYRRGRLAPFAFLTVALFFMAGLHGFVSVNVVRYNIPMVALYAFVTAYALADLFGQLSRRAGLPDSGFFNTN